jgi:hypothetical protein
MEMMEALDKIQSDHVLLWSLSLALSAGTGRGTAGDDELVHLLGTQCFNVNSLPR